MSWLDQPLVTAQMKTIKKRSKGRRSNFNKENFSVDTKSRSRSHSPLMNTFTKANVSKKEVMSDIPQEDLLMAPVVTINNDEKKAMDDSCIKRLSLGAYVGLENSVNMSSRTTPRRPPEGGKYYLCPSNTFVASNGEVYHVDPFQLPPPSGKKC